MRYLLQLLMGIFICCMANLWLFFYAGLQYVLYYLIYAQKVYGNLVSLQINYNSYTYLCAPGALYYLNKL